MKKENTHTTKNRDNEKGAALVMALLVSSLLLVASVGLVLETTTNTLNVTDSTSEQQAFNAAESGIQAAVYVLRDNVTLSAGNLLVPNPAGCSTATTAPGLCKENRIDYIKALAPAASNLTTTGLDAVPRLSRWMAYDGTAPDRVKMGETAYVQRNGYAYKLEISDPDNTGSLITYSTTGRLFDCDGCATLQPNDDQPDRRTYGDAVNGIVIRYYPKAAAQINVSAGATNTNFGKFTVTVKGIGAVIPLNNRFEIVTRMTQPYRAVMVIRGYIQTNTCGICSTATAPRIIFDSKTFTLQGSSINLISAGGALAATSVLGPPPGFQAQLTSGSVNVPTDSIIAGTMTSPEPIRLLIKSTGYGPRGSTKQLEAIIQKNFFNGIGAPSTLTLIGPDRTTSPIATLFTFNPGSSNNTEYSGVDVNSTDIIPPIGTSNPQNLETVRDSVDGLPPHPFNGDVIGTPTDVSVETPEWLQSPQLLDATIQSMYTVAAASGRYFPSGVTPTDYGDVDTAQGITFCDGNCEYNGDGGGILVVTGTLTLKGNFNFNGLIIVTGQGGIQRSGGGNGTLQGNVVVAPYQYSQISNVGGPMPTSFLAPQYDLSGGGNSTIVYNSRSLGNGLLAVDNFVLGVVEK